MSAELSDEQVDAELSAAIFCYDPRDKYPEWSNAQMRDAYRAGREDGLAERRDSLMVRSVEELDALPLGTVVKDAEGAVQEKFDNNRWYQPSWTGGRTVDQMLLPALVLYRPDWDTP